MKFDAFDNETKNIGAVWLLNLLVPGAGLGTLYACGSGCIPLLFAVWIYELLDFKMPTVIVCYFMLSLIGTIAAGVRNRNLEERRKIANNAGNRHIKSESIGSPQKLLNGAPDGEGEVHALDTLERKVKEAERRLKYSRRTEEELARSAIEERKSKQTIDVSSQIQSYAEPSTEWPQEVVNQNNFGNSRSESYPYEMPNNEFAPQEPVSSDYSEQISYEEPVEEPVREEFQPYEPVSEIAVPEYASYETAPAEPVSEVQSYEAAPQEIVAAPAPYEGTPQEIEPPQQECQVAPSEPAWQDPVETQTVPETVEAAQSEGQVQQFVDKLGNSLGSAANSQTFSAPSFDFSMPSFESTLPSFESTLPTFDSSQYSFDFSSSALGTSSVADSKQKPLDHCPRCNSKRQSEFSFCLHCGISF